MRDGCRDREIRGKNAELTGDMGFEEGRIAAPQGAAISFLLLAAGERHRTGWYDTRGQEDLPCQVLGRGI